MKTKVIFIKCNVDEVEEEVNKQIEALEVNTRITIKKVDWQTVGGQVLASVLYEEKDQAPEILTEEM